jgi:hypothetical protein
MRLIDADALEKFLADAEMEATRKRKYVLAGALNTIQGNLRNFSTTEPEPHWIPCSERLPEEKKEVLISADGELYIAEYEIYHGKGYWSEVVEYRNVTDVDAWMPLPKPYGGDKE